ncbi:MotA/TolQ/ExbB proton channel family protein [Luteolibacter flavescens]|uniref:MotA/TolQ/ExbB proton channel family protein n=1 Tax=Luteolibacter flavescens TaxID=1859460 RepID=A0ABT3FKR0_9BACT|nr:MotA/TolQ/ExbB proton channel family protein [Luteolibacter flavescens]MCW1883774.1 MotA/TolQ/ExbB proton channel family protein [Luteolibacter flavescens]
MTQPYLPPEAPAVLPESAEVVARRRFWKRAIWISVALTVIPPLVGIGMSATSMALAFSELGESDGGDASELSRHIGGSLIATAIGLTVSIVGLVALIASVICFRSAKQAPAR